MKASQISPVRLDCERNQRRTSRVRGSWPQLITFTTSCPSCLLINISHLFALFFSLPLLWWSIVCTPFVCGIFFFIIIIISGVTAQVAACAERVGEVCEVCLCDTHWCPLVHWRLDVYDMHFKKMRFKKKNSANGEKKKTLLIKNYLNCSSGLGLLICFLTAYCCICQNVRFFFLERQIHNLVFIILSVALDNKMSF